MTPQEEKRFEAVEKKLAAIYNAIVGDPKLGQEGLVPRIVILENHKRDNIRFKNRLVGGTVVLTVALKAIWEGIQHLFP